jgi:hypothetical protein
LASALVEQAHRSLDEKWQAQVLQANAAPHLLLGRSIVDRHLEHQIRGLSPGDRAEIVAAVAQVAKLSQKLPQALSQSVEARDFVEALAFVESREPAPANAVLRPWGKRSVSPIQGGQVWVGVELFQLWHILCQI